MVPINKIRFLAKKAIRLRIDLSVFFIVISPFGGRYPRALRLGFSLDCDYSISG